MAVMLAYTYLGYQGGAQGWYQDVLAQPDVQSLTNWGIWLGNRYKSKSNIIWFGLGDYAPAAGTAEMSRVVAIAKGIKAAGATQPFMAEANNPDSLPAEAGEFGPLLDTDSFYGYGPNGLGFVYQTADRAWRLSPTMPAWMQEGTYEFENNLGHFSGQPWDTRRGRYWSVLAGGTAGDGFGSRDVWQWQNLPASLTDRWRQVLDRRLCALRLAAVVAARTGGRGRQPYRGHARHVGRRHVGSSRLRHLGAHGVPQLAPGLRARR